MRSYHKVIKKFLNKLKQSSDTSVFKTEKF